MLSITRGKVAAPQRVVIYGPEGIGKTSLAAQFPNPLFIDTEGSTTHMDVARTPTPTSWTMLLQMVSEIQRNPQGFHTLVIDTADWAERMAIAHLCAKHNCDGIEGMGYGKGYVYLAEDFGRLLDALNQVPMHVVLTAHAQTRKFELPEETGAYDRWELKLAKKTAPMVKEWADMVLFCNYQIFVETDEKTKRHKADGGKRVMHTQHHPCWDAKNRHELASPLPLDYASIAHCFPVPQVQAPAPAAPVATSPAPATAPTRPELVQLRGLMEQAGVSDPDLIAVIATRGYFPATMQVDNLPADFINKMLLPHWEQVKNAIKESNHVE
jgi:hypothetical protein